MESAETITRWGSQFGATPTEMAARANHEMAELISALVNNPDPSPEIVDHILDEVADVCIVVYQILGALRPGVPIQALIDRKMARNRARTWAANGDGVYHHDSEPSALGPNAKLAMVVEYIKSLGATVAEQAVNDADHLRFLIEGLDEGLAKSVDAYAQWMGVDTNLVQQAGGPGTTFWFMVDGVEATR